MPAFDSTAGFWILGGVQLLGLTSAWMARLSEGSEHQAICQRLFFLGLVLMGLTTMLTAGRPGLWLMSAVTLAVSLLVVICDFRHAKRSAWTLSEF